MVRDQNTITHIKIVPDQSAAKKTANISGNSKKDLKFSNCINKLTLCNNKIIL